MLERNRDRPPKDTSEAEIEEWNASAVIFPSVDPGYGTYVRMWKPIPAPWPGTRQGVQGLPLRGAFPGSLILRNFDVIMKCSKPIVGCSKPIVRDRNRLSAALTSNRVRN